MSGTFLEDTEYSHVWQVPWPQVLKEGRHSGDSLLPVEGLFGHRLRISPYGAAALPADNVTPGDVYIDLTPGVRTLYANSESLYRLGTGRGDEAEALYRSGGTGATCTSTCSRAPSECVGRRSFGSSQRCAGEDSQEQPYRQCAGGMGLRLDCLARSATDVDSLDLSPSDLKEALGPESAHFNGFNYLSGCKRELMCGVSCASATFSPPRPPNLATTDDLPWPDLDKVSRGGTRGNQGQKGVLDPADSQGRCILQLRVQRDVLPVRLNRQASEWYRILETEVTRAQNLTKTFWRKARRRQDYDARADQDHMELHEWLQQLKDKTMYHIEILIEKGSIRGPPYAMPDHIELTFLRKFLQRQANCIPHNPRLRVNTSTAYIPPHPSPLQSGEPEPEVANSALMTAQFEFASAQRQKVDALLEYQKCLENEYEASLAVKTAEKRRDEILATLTHSTRNSQGVDVRGLETFRPHTDRVIETLVDNLEMVQDTVAAPQVLEAYQDWTHGDDLANEKLQLLSHPRKRRHFDDSDEEDRMRARMKRGALHQLNIGGEDASRLAHAVPYNVYRKDPCHGEDTGSSSLQETQSEGEDADAEAETDSDDAMAADRGFARFQEYTPRHERDLRHQAVVRGEMYTTRRHRGLGDSDGEYEIQARISY
ncbi:hypothetical protein B0H12DRAFT_1330010 [Mycena haematopus]|nr:hypothetical protein B0H12DRAFT_1330010 [Mycena haematopus]